MAELNGTTTGFTSLSDFLDAAYETSMGRDQGVLIDTGGGNTIFIDDVSIADMLLADVDL